MTIDHQLETDKSNWLSVRFDQMAEQVNQRVEPNDADADIYVGLEHLDSESLKIRRWGSPADVGATKLVFRKGDIIFGRRRVYQRKLAVADFDGICSAHAMVLRARPCVVLPEFLPFFMQSDLFMNRALEISVGSLSPTINWHTLAIQEFALPPLAEQRRIAEVLGAIEQCLQAVQIAHQKSWVLWRAISAKEFNRATECVDRLERHYAIPSGQVDPRDEEFADLPLIAPNHIESETGELLELETAREQGAISGKYLYEPGVVIYSKIRPNLAKVAIAPCRGLCSADMYPLQPEPTLRAEYLHDLLLSDSFTQFAISMSMRTGMPKLNRKQLSRYECRVPSLEQQDEYLEHALAVRSARNALQGRTNELKYLRTAVHQELFSQ